MTREEMYNVVYNQKILSERESRGFVDALKVLGLIEFEEELTAYEVIRKCVNYDCEAAAIERSLKEKGFLK